jgi:hypothetical protein
MVTQIEGDEPGEEIADDLPRVANIPYQVLDISRWFHFSIPDGFDDGQSRLFK